MALESGWLDYVDYLLVLLHDRDNPQVKNYRLRLDEEEVQVL